MNIPNAKGLKLSINDTGICATYIAGIAVYMMIFINPGNIASGYMVNVIKRECVYLWQAFVMSPSQNANNLTITITLKSITADISDNISNQINLKMFP